MNLILFEQNELDLPLPLSDRRASHVLQVLRRGIGDTFDVGVVDGPIGKATLVALSPESLSFTFSWGPPAPPLDPISLLIGLPRPQTARDILRDATTLGVASLHFIATERSDTNYAASSLWTSGEWRKQRLGGAAQAFTTRLPTVTFDQPLVTALASVDPSSSRLALDNYEATAPLSQCHVIHDSPVTLAFGPERGWGPADRVALRAQGFTLAHLGTRVLRSETAVIAALSLVRAKLGLL